MYKLLALGQDNKLHCCSVNNKGVSACEDKMTIKQVNPDLGRLQKAGIDLLWCYECSALLEE